MVSYFIMFFPEPFWLGPPPSLPPPPAEASQATILGSPCSQARLTAKPGMIYLVSSVDWLPA